MVSLEIFFLCEHVNDNQPCVVFIPWLGNIALQIAMLKTTVHSDRALSPACRQLQYCAVLLSFPMVR